MGRRVTLVLLVALAGCSSVERAQPAPTVAASSLVLAVDADDRPRAVAAVVRTTTRRIVLLAASRGRLPDRLSLARGDERLPTAPGEEAPPPGPGEAEAPDVAVIDAPRRWEDLRPLGPAARPSVGAPVVVVLPGATARDSIVLVRATVSDDSPRALLLASLPFASTSDVRPAAQRAQDAVGGLVIAPGGALLGFVTGAQGERPVVTPLDALDGLLAAVTASEGRDVVAAGDEAPIYRLSVRSATNLPEIHDEWGEPDLYLGVELGERALEPLPLFDLPGWDPGPGAPAAPRDGPLAERLVRAQGEQGPVRLRLLERDVTLAEGDVLEELAPPVERASLEPGRIVAEFVTAVPLPSTSGALVLQPVAPAGPARIVLDVSRVDPDATSGDDRTPLGAALAGAVRLGRVVSGELDVDRGDGTDFLALDVEGDVDLEPVLVILLRRAPAASLRLQVFPPDFSSPLLDLAAPAGRHLTVAATVLPRGRLYARLAHEDGPGTAWSLLVAERGDPDGAVRALLRLVSREAEAGLPYLGSPSFAREVAGALTFRSEGNLDPAAASAAVLSELGARASETRRLALRLLDDHLRPPLEELARIFDLGEGARRTDAGLLLALRRPGDLRVGEVVALAAADPDAHIKRMALTVASRVEDPERRAALIRAARESDHTGTIERELDRY